MITRVQIGTDRFDLGRETSLQFFKGTVSVISSDPSWKYNNALYTTVFLKALSDQAWINVNDFENYLFSIEVSLQNDLRISPAEKHLLGIRMKTLFHLDNCQYLPHYWSYNGFNGTVMNRALPSLQGGSLEITLTVSLNPNSVFISFQPRFLEDDRKEIGEMRRQQQEILNIEGGGESMSIMYGTLLRQALTLNKQHWSSSCL